MLTSTRASRWSARTAVRRAFAVGAALALFITSVAMAATATLSIDSVGGQAVERGRVRTPVSGAVEVNGRASLQDAAPPAAETTPLVADAGDSPFVAIGDPATLLGMGFGGAEPYTFAWSADAPIDGADAPTAQLDTSGLAAGNHTVTLTITDSAGTTASDKIGRAHV